MSTTTGVRSVALLEHAIDYTSLALAGIGPEHLDAPTPCAAWTLRDLLDHMDDALAAFTEAALVGEIDLGPVPPAPELDRLVERLRQRACALLAAWRARYGDEPVRIGDGRLEAGVLAGVGALEIAVHGWDVATACGRDHPLPSALADALLEVAADVVAAGDRGRRFAPARPTDSADAGERLLAFLGR
ncbi:TIGR03086 family protein [Nocardioides mangrovicus]|uniref:TIGR03086 family protein n=1 Tax=Nocardioides mangrovicus TaxID=2478913 RepID=A0A3L8NZF6_9ACTN|nr:TIGR03086 family metal-binding protein [Nocardioides mangrovicus]RLV47933.1 TIGR03086 family protein [Nocardioides mangrovicus]